MPYKTECIQVPKKVSRTVVSVQVGTLNQPIFAVLGKQPLNRRIIIGSDRRPETKQGIKGKIDRFRSGRVRVRVRFRSPI